jgi:hypothetical protein
MAIELSNLTFTNQADIVPPSGVDEILNTGIANTLAGNDEITGTGTEYNFIHELINGPAGVFYSISTGFYNIGTLNTADSNDIITGISSPIDPYNSPYNSIGLYKKSYGILTEAGTIDTGNGNDIITGISEATIRDGTTNHKDFLLTGYNSISNKGGTINTGNGNDSIISKGRLYNIGMIFLGDGNDSFIADGEFDGTGSVFLENGQDYLKGFGSGNFNGGNGQDILELTSGSYSIGISGATVNFTKDSTMMVTSEFEKLIAGNTIYNFTSLTAGQIITVA